MPKALVSCRRRRSRFWRICLGAALALACPLGASAPLPAWRPTQARLVGLPYSAWGGDAGSEAALAQRLAVASALERLSDVADPAQAERGELLRRVFGGDFENAMRSLERRLATADDVGARSDLAALHLARGADQDRPFDVVLALDLLASGTRTLPEERWNLALARELLGLRVAARAAWQEVVRTETDPGWTAEAADHVARLAKAVREDQWRAARSRLLGSGARLDDDLRRLVVREPGEAFDLASYGALAAWGADCEDGSTADTANCRPRLRLVRDIGEALASPEGAELVAAAKQAEDSSGGARRALARGYVALAEGARHAARRESESARAAFATAASLLRRADSPLLAWADYGQAATFLHDGGFERVRSAIAAPTTPSGDRRLQASRARTLGTAEFFARRLPEAADWYRRAAQGFGEVGDTALQGEAEGYLGDVLSNLGQLDDEWRWRTRALGRLSQWPQSSAWLDALNYAAYGAASEGKPFAALELAGASVEAEQAGSEVDPVRAVETRAFLARALVRAGRRNEGLAEYGQAREAVTHVPDLSLRRRLESDVLLESNVLAAGPQGAAAERARSLTAAIVAYRRLGVSLYLDQAYEARARAWKDLGRRARAEADLAAGLDAHRAALAEFRDAFAALQLAEGGQRLYDAMVELQLDQRRDAWAATDFGDRAKDELLERLGGDAPARTVSPLSARAVQAALQADEAALVFTLLPKRLLITVVRSDGNRSIAVDLAEGGVGAGARELLALLASDTDPAAVQRAGARLYEQLIRPAAPLLRGIRRLVLVPDRELNLVPFAALFDARRGRYLVEDITLCLSPSLRHWLRLTARQRAPGRTPSPWHAVALAPAGANRDGDLPGARSEAAAVADLYGGSALIGAAATRSALLTSLATADVLHFAGHARSEPEAPEQARLVLSAADGAAQPLFASELAGLDLRHLSLVVLSGCETALPSARRSITSDGIAVTFLARGATAVVATLWPAEDRDSVRLMSLLHRRIAAGEDVAAALRSTQLELLHGDDPAARRPHAWAFCQLTGLSVHRPVSMGGAK